MKKVTTLDFYREFCRNFENHCNDAEWFSDNYHCDRNVFDVSETLTEALWINELLCNAYQVSGFGESILISYLQGSIDKETMIIHLILAGDKNVKALRDQREVKHSANEKPRTFSTRRGGNRRGGNRVG